MLHIEHSEIKELLLTGNFGLEKESLRVDGTGHLVHTPHPFSDEEHIDRDFCENQTEINTPVVQSAEEAVASVYKYTWQIKDTLRKLPEQEYLWPSSNPPYIRNEVDIPVAQFVGDSAGKTVYREYLSDRYGRYKMTFSGIHVNYSFSDELLEKDFALSGGTDFTEYKNQLYLTLAEQAVAYGWLLVAISAASPVMDSSFIEKGGLGEDIFGGMASVRCSELGYWNFFTPVFDYTDIRTYADSIQHYVDEGWLRAPSELYYPVRLKPRGINDLETLRNEGVNHIELRMFDLNPLVESGVDVRDVRFAQLFLTWLAAMPRRTFSQRDQVQAIQNFKNAAHYDLKTVKIVFPDGEIYSVAHAALNVLRSMRDFYQGYPEEIREILDFEEAKFIDPETRYAWQVRKKYAGGFVKNVLQEIVAK